MEKEIQKLTENIGNKKDKKQKKDFEATLNILKHEHEKSKKLYQTYRGEKLNEKLSKFFNHERKKMEKIIFMKVKQLYLHQEKTCAEVY